MNVSSSTPNAIWLSAGLAVVGCGGSTATNAGNSGTSGLGADMDSDCQGSCPAVANGGTNCCDMTSGTCFSTPAAACPSQVVGAAE